MSGTNDGTQDDEMPEPEADPDAPDEEDENREADPDDPEEEIPPDDDPDYEEITKELIREQEEQEGEGSPPAYVPRRNVT